MVFQYSFDHLPWIISLTSKKLLVEYTSGSFPTTDNLKLILFSELREHRYDLPDYIHKNTLVDSFEVLKEKFPFSKLLLKSLEEISKAYTFYDGHKIYIKKNTFEEWQNTLTLLPPLPLLSYNIFAHNNYFQDYLSPVKALFGYSCLPTTPNTFVDYLFNSEGTSELHLHFNGTTESTLVWLDVLKEPYKYYSYIKKSKLSNEVNELYYQLGSNLSEDTLFLLLNRCKIIREYLVAFSCGILSGNEKDIKLEQWFVYCSRNNIITRDLYTFPSIYTIHPYETFSNTKNELINETLFLVKIYEKLKDCPNEKIAQLLHFYILVQAYFQRLLIHQVDQYGFDQFQKITMNELRENIEQESYKRFKQLENLYRQPLEYLEIRFSPKANLNDNVALINSILKGYDRYKAESAVYPELILVAHFIRKKDSLPTQGLESCRNYQLRRDLEVRSDALISLVKNHPKVRPMLRGIDVAANELHASPEVFAPIFRRLHNRYTRAKLHEFQLYEKDQKNPSLLPKLFSTYHAGEDFVHILSGIRTVYEAVKFLGFNEKCRIGHATSLGIDPSWWRSRVGNSLKIKQGEWLDNLTLFHHFISGKEIYLHLKHNIEEIISQISKKIYGKSHSPHNLFISYKGRSLDPLIYCGFKNRCDCLDPLDLEEFNMVDNFESNYPQEFQLLKEYHKNDVREKFNKIITVKLDPNWDEAIFTIQQSIIRLLNSREIAIETMPTSNVKISFYENYKDHHIFNWFHPIPEENKKTETPYLVLASDDPGIFSNNLRIEFTHLYEAAIDKGATPQQVELWLKALNENAKRFRF